MGRAGAFLLSLSFLWSGVAAATPDLSKDLLIKFRNPEAILQFTAMANDGGAKVETLGTRDWLRVQLNDQQLHSLNLKQIRKNPNVLFAQPNYPIRLPENYRSNDPAVREKLLRIVRQNGYSAPADNPEIPKKGANGRGRDPLFARQWGMNDIGVKDFWLFMDEPTIDLTAKKPVIVAVIDTGVDYTHEDLVDNLWHNPGEIPNNGIDDDRNGYVDDVIGWDFVSNDNLPYDLSVDPIVLILMGGNPGHGTHCAGNIAAVANNGTGIVGVAPKAQIMSLRFLNERGGGTTADAVKAIDYAVDNGAKIMNNSWGGEGENPSEEEANLALRESIKNAQDKGVLFVAAAGNGHGGVGYDNDTDPLPAFPASYDDDIIISVAAVDTNNVLGEFSNWGAKTVDIAAPGVSVFSTMVGGRYDDVVVDLAGFKATWDGTSMAAPHVAGAAALYWSKNPRLSWRKVKKAILKSAKPLENLKDKMVSGGKLSVEALMN